MMNDIIGTIVCPFTDKGIVNEIWLDGFVNNLDLDLSRWKLVFHSYIEETKAIGIYEKISSMGFYDSIHIHSEAVDIGYNLPLFITKGSEIGRVWNETRRHIEGDLVVMIEDDIVIPKGGVATLINDLIDYPDAGMIGALQRDKIKDSILVYERFMRRLTDYEFDDKPLKIQSMATGLVVTYSNLYNLFNMNSMSIEFLASQNIAYSLMINKFYNKKTYADPRVETIHLHDSEIKNGELKSPIPPNIDIPQYIFPENKHTEKNYTHIFICGFSPNSGSSWILRILSTHSGLTVFGEPNGIDKCIFDCADKMILSTKTKESSLSSRNFQKYHGSRSIDYKQPRISLYTTRRRLFDCFYGENNIVIKSDYWTPSDIIKLHHSFNDAFFIFVDRDIENYNVNSHIINTNEEEIRWNYKNMKLFMEHIPENMAFMVLKYEDIKKDAILLCQDLETKLKLGSNSLNRNIEEE